MTLHRVLWAVAAFAVIGSVGPVLRLVIAPPALFDDPLSPAAIFVYDLVIYLWPTGLLALGSPPGASKWGIIAIGSNVLLFALVGVVVGVLARRRGATLGIFVAMTSILFMLAFRVWGIVHWPALLVALAVHAIPFAVVMNRASRRALL